MGGIFQVQGVGRLLHGLLEREAVENGRCARSAGAVRCPATSAPRRCHRRRRSHWRRLGGGTPRRRAWQSPPAFSTAKEASVIASPACRRTRRSAGHRDHPDRAGYGSLSRSVAVVVRREGGAALVVGAGRGTQCHPAGGDCGILNFREGDDTQRLRRITFPCGIEVMHERFK